MSDRLVLKLIAKISLDHKSIRMAFIGLPKLIIGSDLGCFSGKVQTLR